jgi:hypothetical protein
MPRNLPHTLPDDLLRTWNAGLASSKATVSRVSSELLRQGTAARERFDALPSPTRLVVGNDLGEEVRVPVHVVTKLSFDQRILDADASAASTV